MGEERAAKRPRRAPLLCVSSDAAEAAILNPATENNEYSDRKKDAVECAIGDNPSSGVQNEDVFC